jgi:hypothetical protein
MRAARGLDQKRRSAMPAILRAAIVTIAGALPAAFVACNSKANSATTLRNRS